MKFASNKPLIFIIILLVITNGILLFFFVSGNRSKKSNHDSGGLYSVLKDSVGFNSNQLEQYRQLREDQFQKMKPLFQKVNQTKETFYQLIYLPDVNDSLLHREADSIGIHQKEVDMQMFQYFKQVRNICTQEQLPKFDSTYKKVIRKMIGKRSRSKKH